jgi:hypothetical protein
LQRLRKATCQRIRRAGDAKPDRKIVIHEGLDVRRLAIEFHRAQASICKKDNSSYVVVDDLRSSDRSVFRPRNRESSCSRSPEEINPQKRHPNATRLGSRLSCERVSRTQVLGLTRLARFDPGILLTI